MKILAFDQSLSRTGWALYETTKDPSGMMIGSFTSSPKPRMEDEVRLEIFGTEIKRLFVAHKPDFVCWEKAQNVIRSYKTKGRADLLGNEDEGMTVNAKQLLLRDLQGQIRQACIDWRVPWVWVTPGEWRARVYGKGFGRLPKKESKAKAKDHCSLLGISFKNEDEAEAGCIALYAKSNDRFRLLEAQK